MTSTISDKEKVHSDHQYSRIPFVYACVDMNAKAIISHLTNLFSIFGLAGFIHSDIRSSLFCDELRSYLLELGVGFSNSSVQFPDWNSSVCNPCWNGHLKDLMAYLELHRACV